MTTLIVNTPVYYSSEYNTTNFSAALAANSDYETIPPNTPTVYFRSEDGLSEFSLPFAPSTYSIDNLASVYNTIDRPGKKPLLIYERESLINVSMDLFIGPKQQTFVLPSVDGWLTNFRTYIRQRKRWRFAYDPQVSAMWWRFTSASIVADLRSPIDNKITAATVSVTLTESVDYGVAVGPVSGGTPATTPTSGTTSGSTTRTYTVKSGDTLWGIAYRLLGSGSRYGEIATLNGITNPSVIYVGQVLKIPSS